MSPTEIRLTELTDSELDAVCGGILNLGNIIKSVTLWQRRTDQHRRANWFGYWRRCAVACHCRTVYQSIKHSLINGSLRTPVMLVRRASMIPLQYDVDPRSLFSVRM